MDPATLRAWRDARALSTRDAAEKLGVPARTLEGLEQGRSPASPLWGPIARIIELLATLDHKTMSPTPTPTNDGERP